MCIRDSRSGDRAVLEVAVDPGFAAVGAVVGVDVALVVDDVDHAGVGDRTGDAVDLRIPDELTVRRAHAHEVALEEMCIRDRSSTWAAASA